MLLTPSTRPQLLSSIPDNLAEEPFCLLGDEPSLFNRQSPMPVKIGPATPTVIAFDFVFLLSYIKNACRSSFERWRRSSLVLRVCAKDWALQNNRITKKTVVLRN